MRQAHPTRPAGPAHYVEAATLAALVRAYRRERRVSEDLARVLVKIAGGVWDRYRFTDSRDDFTQEVFLHLVGRPLKKADPKKNLFSYFTTCVVWFGQKLRDRAAADRRRFDAYAAAAAEAGRAIPRRG